MLKYFLVTALSLSLGCGAFANEYEDNHGTDVPPAAGTGSGPAPSAAGTNSMPQTCTASCNRSYDVCMDQQSAVPGDGDALRYNNNLADKLIGATSDCKDNLTSCLNGCGG
jgi:hypothetical protein